MKHTKFLKILVTLVMFTGCTRYTPEKRTPANELGGAQIFDMSESIGGSTQAVNTSLRPEARPAGLDTSAPSQARGAEYRAPLTGINTDFNELCRGFIARDGSIGPWGREFIQAMRDVEAASGGQNIFFGSGGSNMIRFGSRCRSTEHFQSLTRAQQEHIWAWTWASIAQSESSCSPRAQAQGIWNRRFQRFNTADGLMQLEYNTSTRNANNRDTRFCPNNTNSQAITFQARCSAHIMANSHAGDFLYTQGGNTTYWDKLRFNNGNIFKLLKLHPLCR